jgi:hypothetical protein
METSAMRRMKVPAYLGPLSFSIFLLAALLSPMASTHTLHAQNVPTAGATVVVKMIDAVDSGSDSAGKQYRASVTKPVNSGNGVTIAQGAAATVTLASSGSGRTAQLSSVTINGQTVTVTSSSASVTSAAQNAVGSATNAVNSVLGGFGHHTNAPAAVSAVATGQRVILPPGTTLSFVLSAATPANTPPTAASPTPVSPSPAPSAASSEQMYYTLCRYQGQKDANPIMYVTPIIHTDVAATTISASYIHYIEATYDMSKVKFGSGYCRAVSSSADQQANTMSMLEKQWAASKTEVIRVDWTYTPAQAAASTASVAASAAPTAAANENYVLCSSDPDEPVIYFSEVFAAEMPPGPASATRGNGAAQRNASAKFQTAFLAFLQKQYSFKSGSNYPIGCAVTFTPTAAGLRAAQTRKQQMEDQYKQAKKQVVETGWKNQ